MLLQPEFTEIGLTLVSLGLLFIYHFQLYRQMRDNRYRFDQSCQARLGVEHR